MEQWIPSVLPQSPTTGAALNWGSKTEKIEEISSSAVLGPQTFFYPVDLGRAVFSHGFSCSCNITMTTAEPLCDLGARLGEEQRKKERQSENTNTMLGISHMPSSCRNAFSVLMAERRMFLQSQGAYLTNLLVNERNTKGRNKACLSLSQFLRSLARCFSESRLSFCILPVFHCRQ